MMQSQQQRQMPPANVASGPPPAPMRTRVDRSQRAQVPNNRPDMGAARGGNDAVNLEDTFAPVGPQAASRSTRSDAPPRPENERPSDIGDIFVWTQNKNSECIQ